MYTCASYLKVIPDLLRLFLNIDPLNQSQFNYLALERIIVFLFTVLDEGS
jgi:hypothetical protein